MQDVLVGSTGFVGQNILQKHNFTKACHSTDVKDCYGMRPDLVVYSGVPAAMFLANENPEADLQIMEQARENLRKIDAHKVVLISSIAVLSDSRGVDEDTVVSEDGQSAYGKNRLQLEKWVREDFSDATIIRLPALYGEGLKKNFLYDLHTITPAMLRPEKYEELSGSSVVRDSYELAGNGFYVLKGDADKDGLYAFFSENDFNALAFTDSRSRYQFYHLNRLWADIELAVKENLPLLHIATEPVSAEEVYEAVTGRTGWKSELGKPPFDYDLRTKYADAFGGANGYLVRKSEELNDIVQFMRDWKR